MHKCNYWMCPVAKIIHISDISCVVSRMCTAAINKKKEISYIWKLYPAGNLY